MASIQHKLEVGWWWSAQRGAAAEPLMEGQGAKTPKPKAFCPFLYKREAES